MQVKKKSSPGNYTRDFELQDLISDDQIIKSRFPQRFDMLERYLRRKIDPDSILIEGGPQDRAIFKVNGKTTSVFGYFQDSNVVEEIWPTLNSKLLHSQKFKSIFNAKLEERITVHMRFGDYFEDSRTKSVHGLTKLNYFQDNVLRLASQNKEIKKLLVVTDDGQSAGNYFQKHFSNLDVKVLSSHSAVDDLKEISCSSHVIMSNSTFSWWGGWLAYNLHNSHIICPRPWFADSSDPDLPIYFRKWETLRRDFEA